MPWAEGLQPARMSRVAIVAADRRLRDTLLELARSGLMEVDIRPVGERPSTEQAAAFAAGVSDHIAPATRIAADRVTPRVTARARGVDELERAERWDLIAGELELGRMTAQAIKRRGAAVLVGWTPRARVAELSGRLVALGTAVQEL